MGCLHGDSSGMAGFGGGGFPEVKNAADSSAISKKLLKLRAAIFSSSPMVLTKASKGKRKQPRFEPTWQRGNA